MSTKDKKTPFFDIHREELWHWPYTLHQIDETLDVGLIEGRGKQLLYQAITDRRLTAFVGSGASMAYGRLSWHEWQARVISDVEKFANVFDEAAEKTLTYQRALIDLLNRTPEKLAPPHFVLKLKNEYAKNCDVSSAENEGEKREIKKAARRIAEKDARNLLNALKAQERVLDMAHRDVKQLRNTFDLASEKSGYFPGGEEAPVKLQIVEQLHDLLRKYSKLIVGKDFLEQKTSYIDNDVESAFEQSMFGMHASNRSGVPTEGIIRFQEHFKNTMKYKFSSSTASMEYEDKKTNAEDCMNEYKVAFELLYKTCLNPYAKLPFSQLNKNLLVDECPHAEQLLLNGMKTPYEVVGVKGTSNEAREALREELQTELGILDNSNLKRDIDGIRQRPDRYRVLSAFTFDKLKVLIKSAKKSVNPNSQWIETLDLLKEDIDKYLQDKDIDGRGQRHFLTPTSRFLIEMLMRLTDGIGSENWLEDEKSNKELSITFLTKSLFEKINPSDYNSRRSIVKDHFDTLPRLVRELNISRFLTFNYDFEIERVFQDGGFNPMTPAVAQDTDASHFSNRRMDPRDTRTDGIGSPMRDLAFRRETASNLIGFSTGSDGADAAVYHLHGRATRDGKIVATERDYMDLYLKQDDMRAVVDECLHLTFSANPILFVGVGMDETDVLRPLRQFVSNNDRDTSYNSTVLLPAEKDFAARAKMAAGLFVRYGVHTIFYGNGLVEQNDNKKVPMDWLHRILTLNTEMKNVLEERLRNTMKDDETRTEKNKERSIEDLHTREKILERLNKAVGEIEIEEINNEEPKKLSALASLFGENDYKILLKRNGVKLKDPQFASLHPKSKNTFGNTNEHHSTVELDGSSYTSFYTKILTQVFFLTLGASNKKHRLDDIEEIEEIKEDQRSLAAAISATNGLHGALLTACLNAALDGIAKEQQLWWKHWQKSPPHRSARFERIKSEPFTGDDNDESERRKKTILPRRYIRHRIINTITHFEEDEKQTAPQLILDMIDLKQKASIRNMLAQTEVRAHLIFLEAIVATRVQIATGKVGDFDLDTKSLKRLSRESRGRRIHSVVADRGLGKGAFVAALATRSGLSGYIEAQWGNSFSYTSGISLSGEEKEKIDSDPVRKENNTPVFLSAVFINLSFSSEIASIYDMIGSALMDACAMKKAWQEWKNLAGFKENTEIAALNICLSMKRSQENPQDDGKGKAAKGQKQKQAVKLFDEYCKARAKLAIKYDKMPRTAYLKRILNEFHEIKLCNNHARILICINGLDLLYTADRQPKNSEIEDILGFLFSDEAKKLPFDLIATGSLENMGEPWKPHPKTPAMGSEEQAAKNIFSIHNQRPHLSQEGAETLARLQETSKINFLNSNHEQKNACLEAARSIKNGKSSLLDISNQIHFMRAVKPTALLVNNFKLLTLALYMMAATKNNSKSCDDLKNVKLQTVLNGSRAKIAEAWKDGNTPQPWEEYAKINDDVVYKVWEQVFHTLGDSSDVLKSLTENMVESGATPQIGIYNEAIEVLGGDLSSVPQTTILNKITKAASARYDLDGGEDLVAWQDIRRTLGSNRFSLSILLAAAQDLASRQENIFEAAIAAEDFLLNTVEKVRTSSKNQREELVLSIVLKHYQRYQVSDRPEDNFELHQRILRHLAAIGSPVSADILVRMPDIRDYFSNQNEEYDVSRRTIVARALYALCSRGIVFRLSAHPRLLELGDQEEENDEPEFFKEYRYALHRSVQRHVLERFGTMSDDPNAMNNYSPSLYASMPSGLPRLNHEAYQFMSKLMDNLSQYPDLPMSKRNEGSWTFARFKRDASAQALRAALSMIRTSFSIAVVSRFEDYKDIRSDEPRKRSYFDTHRVRLRWIIRKSWEILDPEIDSETPGPDRIDYKPNAEWKQVNTLYRDEIVWLYNEVGLTSLVQGNMPEAVSHLRQAIEFNRIIEGAHEGGRQHNRISLNLAMTQIERGKLASAKERLETVLAAEKNRNGRIYHLTMGYLALCNHIMGNSSGAEDQFKMAISYLQGREDFRSTAVLGNHQARLLSKNEPIKALETLDKARSAAEAGGHEDIRRHIIISEVGVEMKQAKAGTAEEREQISIRAQAKLQGVLEYARLMGIPALECDALLLRGVLLMNQNEHDTAGKTIIRSIALAKRNELALRLNSAITVYGDLLIRRGKMEAAERVLYESLEMAKRNFHRIEVIKVQRQLDRLFARS